jgi:hypothetical protein
MEAIAAKIQDGKTTMIKVTGEQALIEGQSGKCMNHSCDVGEGQLGIRRSSKEATAMVYPAARIVIRAHRA